MEEGGTYEVCVCEQNQMRLWRQAEVKLWFV